MKTVAIIPAVETWQGLNPLTKVEDNPVRDVLLLDKVYMAAKSVPMIDMVVVTSDSREVGAFCNDMKIAFFPSSPRCISGTHRCADVATRFRPEANISKVVCWPISEPMIPPVEVNGVLEKHRMENVSTMAKNVTEAELDEFYADSNRVKMRVINQQQVDFSRCPLPMSLHHLGLYVFSLELLKRLGRIEPTRLSKAEKLEQLTWLQYSHDHATFRINPYVISNRWNAPISVHTPEDADRLKGFLCAQSK